MMQDILARAMVATFIAATTLWPFTYGLLLWLQIDRFIAGISGAFLASLITTCMALSIQKNEQAKRQ